MRSTHEKLFFGPLLEALSDRPGPLTATAAEERLRAFGFLDIRATRAALEELTRGFTRTSKLMVQLLPLLLEWCSESPDPDLALLQLRRLAEGPARSSNLAIVFRDTPGAAQRTCRILGSSRMLGDALRRQPEFVQLLGDDHVLAAPKPRERFVDEARAAVEWRASRRRARAAAGCGGTSGASSCASRRATCSSFADLVETGRDLSTLAEACLEASLAALAPQVPFAVIGMGRFGGLRPLVRVGPRRAVRLRRRRRRPTTTRPSASRRSCCSRSASGRRKGARSRSTPRCGPRASRVR